MIDEKTRNEMLELGIVRDMMALGDRVPPEVVIWLLEHGTFLFLDLC